MLSIALYHFHVTQIKRSAGQSAVASAAYRVGEKLHSEYYGEDSDYTRKGGVICSEILLPSHAPPEYADRETLWNAVEKTERGKKAQLAYSFDIALQNEFSMQENIELARQFLLDNFVSRGMVVDFAVHSPDKEDGGISNPHFHVMCPIRPIEPDGKWGNKQRREYVLDEHGERVRDEAGNYVFNAVPTTDWGSPETLEHWRQAWADLCNGKFAEKGLDCRIDHRSYARQGIEQIPTVHEGPSVRAMEAKGIRTDKGNLNRSIKAANRLLRNIKAQIGKLKDWLAELFKAREAMKVEQSQSPDLANLLMRYLSIQREKSRKYSQRWQQQHAADELKAISKAVNLLSEKGICTLEELDAALSAVNSRSGEIRNAMKARESRMKQLQKLIEQVQNFQKTKPVHDEYKQIRWKSKQEKFAETHRADLTIWNAANRYLRANLPDMKLTPKAWQTELAALTAENETAYAELKAQREEVSGLQKVRRYVDIALQTDAPQKAKTKQRDIDR